MDSVRAARLLVRAAREAGTLRPLATGGVVHAPIVPMVGSCVRQLEYVEEQHPRDERGRWTDVGESGETSSHFIVPENFTLADAQYDVSTKLPLDTMVVASVDLSLLSSEYQNDYRVRKMVEVIKSGAKFPPLTLEQRSNGKLAILDGRTRVAAFREAGIKGKVPAVIRLEEKGTERSLPNGVTVDKKRTASLRRTDIRGAAAHKETALHKTADTHLPKLSVALRYAFARGRKALGRDANVEAAVKAVASALREVLPGTLVKIAASGGEVAVGALPQVRAAKRSDKPRRDIGPLKMRFDATNQRVIDWADRHAAELITGISETTRENINNAVAEALEQGSIKDLYDEILDAVGDETRADLIARTEVMTAANEGQREGWRQAADEGLLPASVRVGWIATEQACPECEGLDGQTRVLDGEYEGGVVPPAHPRCRCTEGIVG